MSPTPIPARSRLTALATVAASAVTLLLSWPTASRAAAQLPDGFIDVLVTDDLHGPMSFTFLPDGRALVVELVSASIQLVHAGTTTDLGVVPDVNHGAERGLLGIAVDPRWPEYPYLYVNYNRIPNEIVISRLTVGGDLNATDDGHLVIDWDSRHDVISGLPDDNAFHNGGALRFGPDGMLYVSLGDDVLFCAAQVLPTLVGKILRMDVSGLPGGPGGPPPRAWIAPASNPFSTSEIEDERLIWALGVRNPFRFSIDSVTGFLYVGDVGHGRWEEITELTTGGLNLGWPRFEGPDPFFVCPPAEVEDVLGPIVTYDHGRTGEEAIMAGPVYRRRGATSFPLEYEGDLFYSDFYHGELTRLHRGDLGWEIAPQVPGQMDALAWGRGFEFVSDYGVAPDGSLWYCNLYSGEMRRIVPEARVASVPLRPDAPARRGIYDVQGRRVDRPEQGGVYFGKGRRTVVLP